MDRIARRFRYTRGRRAASACGLALRGVARGGAGGGRGPGSGPGGGASRAEAQAPGQARAGRGARRGAAEIRNGIPIPIQGMYLSALQESRAGM
jgi:hypothetical protein